MRRRPAIRWPSPTALLPILFALAVLGAVLGVAGPAAAQAPPQRIVTIRDAETEHLIRRLSHPLFRTAGVDPALVRVTLIQNRAINAFVSTGNRMFLHTGLIQQARSAAEVVGVIAHETGHIAGGHLARLPEEMRNAMLRSIGAMLLGGAAAAATGESGALGAGMLGGQAAAMGGFFAFTRGQEQAADQAALTYLDRLGWPATGMERLLERLLEQELLAAARQDPYFRTHPLSRDRLDFVREQLARARMAGAALPAGTEDAFAMVRAKLDGFLDAPATTWRRYPESDGSAPARHARAIAQFRSGRVPAAIAILDGLLREQPSSPWLHELKGQILFEGGRPAEALGPYVAAVRLAPEEGLSPPLARARADRAR
jgi:predicted Zn-dependent protease